jgi:hypothetical protein
MHGAVSPLTHIEPRFSEGHAMKTATPLLVALVAAVLGAATSVYAQEATSDAWIREARSTKTVEQVKAELAQARRDGTVHAVTPGYDFVARSESNRLRLQVRADLYKARETGELDALNNEAWNFASVRRSPVHAKQ